MASNAFFMSRLTLCVVLFLNVLVLLEISKD